jgi:hypothetical protein
MGWILSLVIIAILIAFNMFAADTMVRLRRDVMEIHKAVVVAPAPAPVPVPKKAAIVPPTNK